jgi:hypothetical protein
MTLERLLRSIGKATFVKYYYSFRDKSRDYCITNFEENYTDKAKTSRTNHAQRIFRDGLEKEALIIIAESNRVDSKSSARAKEILLKEFNMNCTSPDPLYK